MDSQGEQQIWGWGDGLRCWSTIEKGAKWVPVRDYGLKLWENDATASTKPLGPLPDRKTAIKNIKMWKTPDKPPLAACMLWGREGPGGG